MDILRRAPGLLVCTAWLLSCAKWAEPDKFACESEADCEANEQCLADILDDKFCFGPCSGSLDCPTSYECDGSRCVPRDCTSTEDCATGWRCTEYGSCEKPCTSDSVCAPHACGSGTCDFFCLVDADCAAGARCSNGDCSY